jgi:NAD(P)-dependent dehydrogenase (short-subunit alcohol dehydrogenase family)
MIDTQRSEKRLQGRKALITGASRGLGRALALIAAHEGASVALVSRGEPALAEVVREIRAGGGHAHAIVADVALPDAAVQIAHQATALLGEVDLVVHNASQLGPTPLRSWLDTESEDLAAVLQTNLIGPFRLTKALVGPMRLRNRGEVVLISSDAAVEPYPTWGPYAVSKAALDHFGRILAEELTGEGLRVFSVDPGEMDTQMHAAAIPDADPNTLGRPEDVAARIVDMIADPERAPSGGRFLASQWKEVAA